MLVLQRRIIDGCAIDTGALSHASTHTINRHHSHLPPLGPFPLSLFRYALYDYNMISSNTLVGLAIMLTRLILWLVTGLFCLGRIDLLLPGPGQLEMMDIGYRTYVALVRQDHRYNMSVVFFNQMMDHIGQYRRNRARQILRRHFRLTWYVGLALRAIPGMSKAIRNREALRGNMNNFIHGGPHQQTMLANADLSSLANSIMGVASGGGGGGGGSGRGSIRGSIGMLGTSLMNMRPRASLAGGNRRRSVAPNRNSLSGGMRREPRPWRPPVVRLLFWSGGYADRVKQDPVKPTQLPPEDVVLDVHAENASRQNARKCCIVGEDLSAALDEGLSGFYCGGRG